MNFQDEDAALVIFRASRLANSGVDALVRPGSSYTVRDQVPAQGVEKAIHLLATEVVKELVLEEEAAERGKAGSVDGGHKSREVERAIGWLRPKRAIRARRRETVARRRPPG
jgi:hypothetical protein